jgi:hypothetical protein
VRTSLIRTVASLAAVALLATGACGDDGGDGPAGDDGDVSEDVGAGGDGTAEGATEDGAGSDADAPGGDEGEARSGGDRCEVEAAGGPAPGSDGSDTGFPLLHAVEVAVDGGEVVVAYTFDRQVDDVTTLILDLGFFSGGDREAGLGQLRAFASDDEWLGAYGAPADPAEGSTMLEPVEAGPRVDAAGATVTVIHDLDTAPDLEVPFEWLGAASIREPAAEGSFAQRPAGICPAASASLGVPADDFGELPLYEG